MSFSKLSVVFLHAGAIKAMLARDLLPGSRSVGGGVEATSRQNTRRQHQFGYPEIS